jgi:hypothetical protein
MEVSDFLKFPDALRPSNTRPLSYQCPTPVFKFSILSRFIYYTMADLTEALTQYHIMYEPWNGPPDAKKWSKEKLHWQFCCRRFNVKHTTRDNRDALAQKLIAYIEEHRDYLLGIDNFSGLVGPADGTVDTVAKVKARSSAEKAALDRLAAEKAIGQSRTG